MALTQPGSAAGGAVDAPRRPEPTVPQPTVPQPTVPQPTDADPLFEAVRRGLTPGDPVARLLAGWLTPPEAAVGTTRVRLATGTPATTAPAARIPAG
jgi:hypothetical protein